MTVKQTHQKGRKAVTMFMFIIFVAFLVALDLIAMRWGFDSRDGAASPEWGRRIDPALFAHRA